MVEIVGPFERHDLPSGVSVFYREKDHSYWERANEKKPGEWTGSGRLTGMSTVCAPYDFHPDGLMKWAARSQGLGVAALAAGAFEHDDAQTIRAALAWLETGETIWSALSDAKLLYSDLTEQAATRGTNVHKHGLHAMARHALRDPDAPPVPRRENLTAEEWGYVRGVMRFWIEHTPAPMLAEAVVADPALGVAGRLDLIARLHGTVNGQPLRGAVCLLDAKTSGFIPTKHHVQVRGYDRLADASGYGRADRLFILQVDPEGGYELLPVHAEDVDVEYAIHVYRRAGAINREAGKDRRQRDAAQAAVAA